MNKPDQNSVDWKTCKKQIKAALKSNFPEFEFRVYDYEMSGILYNWRLLRIHPRKTPQSWSIKQNRNLTYQAVSRIIVKISNNSSLNLIGSFPHLPEYDWCDFNLSTMKTASSPSPKLS
jgi:hypothetical protein